MKTSGCIPNNKQPMSRVRKAYFIRLAGRCLLFCMCVCLWIWRPEAFDVLFGMNFFKRLSPLHFMWVIWMADMICQLVPAGRSVSLGSHKLFEKRFKPAPERVNYDSLKEYILSTTRSAYKVMVLWLALAAAIGWLYFTKVINRTVMFMITAAFSICDLICVLIWCPFRLLMKTRCCTTCRIFNWDHLMMFTPMVFVKSFYSWSLFFMSLLVFIVWELFVLMYPERFWEQSNDALKCANCTDKLCTQYCRKLTRK